MTAPKPDESAIFNVARQIDDVDAQRLYIEQACNDDPKLQARLEALLRVYEVDPTFLEQPADRVPAETEECIIEVPGRRIGPYKLLEEIGEGGFGKVFMAEQHQPVRRTVALKIIKPGMDSTQVIARFEAERQALAVMDHPNIAKVLDAGTTDSGRPYFVMELVKGIPIIQYADEHRLTPRHQTERD
jgi:eukaryotic-like serine/threonine-protein kinase